MMRLSFLVAATLLLLAQFTVAQDGDIAFPENYRSTFTNYLSLDRVQNPDQVIRLFANDIAMQGPDSDGKLPYGSILVAEIYKAARNADGVVKTSTLGRRIRGPLAAVAVMQREQEFDVGRAQPLNTGSWEFAAFKPDGSDAKKDLDACRACHAPLAGTNYLFSLEHLMN